METIKRAPYTEERKQKARKRMMGNKNALGHKHTEEWKRQASEKMMGNKHRVGKKLSEEAKKVLLSYAINNKVNLGRKASKETRKKLSDAHKGENSWQWKLGLRSKLYGVDWTETLKRSIRERDHYTCQACSRQQESRAFDVHHIDFDKSNNNPDNLITLCADCHRKTVHCNAREYWINYFRTGR